MHSNPKNEPDSNNDRPRRLIRGRDDVRDQLATLVDQAQREIEICVPELDGYLFNTVAFSRGLASFAARHQRNLARILIERAEPTLRNNDRILELARRLSDAVKIHEVGPEDRGLNEMYLVIDHKLFLQQSDATRPEAVLNLQGGVEALRLAERFGEMWDRSSPITALRPLGL